MTTQPLDIAQFSQRFDQLLERHKRRSDMTRGTPPKNLKTYKFDDGNWVEIENEQANREQREPKIATDAEIRVEFAGIMRELCPIYLQMTPKQCATIRQIVAERDAAERHELIGWILEYADSATRRFHRPDDVQLLREGLAAVSIENCGVDFRDTLTTLADLFVRAEEVGVDPRPHFLAVAELSSTARTRGGLDSVAETLREFEKSAVIQERRAMGKPYRSFIPSRP